MGTSKAIVVDILTGEDFFNNAANSHNVSSGRKGISPKWNSIDVTESDYSSTIIEDIDPEPDVKSFYPQVDFSTPELKTALSLLSEVTERLQEALKYLRDENIAGSDDCINRLIVILPELFCCRIIGEGFSAIITALNYATRNTRNDFLDEKDVLALLKMMKRLNSEPFISLDEALNEIEIIEDSGFIIGPDSLSAFLVEDVEDNE